nr:MAG TPA: hypothetical protein [Caudoviricetes sp.]
MVGSSSEGIKVVLTFTICQSAVPISDSSLKFAW